MLEGEPIQEGRDIKVLDKEGKVIFYYNREKDTVEVPFWYWQKIMYYGINTGGLTQQPAL